VNTDYDSRTLLAILKRCTEVSVTVVGDLMLDEYVDGAVERISPEAPVPVVRAEGHEYRLGGAANVARQIAALGAEVKLVGLVGNDAAADTIRHLCQESAIDTASIIATSQRRTTRKLRILSQSQQLLRIDWEDRQAPAQDDSESLLNVLRQLPPPAAIILSDYAKGVLSPPVIAGIMQERGTRPIPIVVDPKHRDFTRYRGAGLLTPNLRELSLAAGQELTVSNLQGIISAARDQLIQGGFLGLVVTMGDRGMLVVLPDGSHLVIPAVKRAVYDVTGAGDTAAAVFTTCLASGATIVAAARIANTAAGIAVGEIGAVAVNSMRIADAIAGAPVNKLLAGIELEAALHRWRASGDQIVFTNGCFDLLHSGHLSLLHYAKSLGDRLVLAINSDAAVRRLKGPSRPVVSQSDRAAMLGALACVDAVTIFDEDTPLEIVKRVRPNILVKGQDYRMDEVIGRDVVEAGGGRVVLAPLLADYSTTSLLARVRA
jgi:D-beta-D-heptose 7-phosphate kinase/D-beta-D-heptose 1-phosphate adenosyltransferase